VSGSRRTGLADFRSGWCEGREEPARPQVRSFWPSRVASLKLRMPLPIPRPISGRRLAPKIRMMMKRMMTSSGIPTRPIITNPFGCGERSVDSITPGAWAGAGAWAAAWAIAALLAGSIVLAAASQFTSGVNAVEVYAAVVDRAGQPIAGLTRGDFTVLEDGRPQTIGTFAEGEFPLSVAVAIDRSFSMAGRELPIARDAAKEFLNALRPEDQSMIVAIGSEVETVSPLSTDRAAQAQAVARLENWGTTGLYDAIIQAIDAIQTAKGRRALVLLSDGTDRYSTASAAQALQRARRSDVMVYPIALGRTRPALFAELASLTGGRSFKPADPKELIETVRTIADELRHQYLLGYTPSTPITPGEEQWRRITVRVNRTDATVRARDGYLAR